MEAWLIGVIVFVCVFGGALGALTMRDYLRDHHRSSDTQDLVKLGVGTIATLASLVLGLMTASVKGNFDDANRNVQLFAGGAERLDDTLRRYGPDADTARARLQHFVVKAAHGLWPDAILTIPEIPEEKGRTPADLIRGVETSIRMLQPTTPVQTELRSEALGEFATLWSLGQQLIADREATLPTAFTVVLACWLTVIFIGFGLFAPRNAVTVTALLICAASLAAAVFLVQEMSGPFDGIVVVPQTPFLHTLSTMARPSL